MDFGGFLHGKKYSPVESSVMLLKYLKITLRNFRRHKITGLINITGLALGISVKALS